MNRQTLMIGAGLLAAVVVALGVLVYLDRDAADGPAPITGPGRAAEARGLIADIESRRAGGAAEPAGGGSVRLLETSGEAATRTSGAASSETSGEAPGQVRGGAGAVTPEPVAEAPTGANAELDAAYDRARELQAAGQLDDAQVLLFFGARRGHARSAFAYAEMNDPNYHSTETSLLAEPDAFQAFRWYSAAADGGVDAAPARLEALREWAEASAASGDAEAERLLLQWE